MMVEKEKMMVAISDNRNMMVDVPCFTCGFNYTLWYNGDDMLEWLKGEQFIQDAMPYLTSGERELLLSNTCDSCFDKMFPPLDNSSDE